MHFALHTFKNYLRGKLFKPSKKQKNASTILRWKTFNVRTLLAIRFFVLICGDKPLFVIINFPFVNIFHFSLHYFHQQYRVKNLDFKFNDKQDY